MRIRKLTAEERVALSLPLQTYSFRPSPARTGVDPYLSDMQPYLGDSLTLAVEDGGSVLAQASAIPMRQNVRGHVHPMGGVAGVASHPLHRGRGHVRTLMNELLGRMRDTGQAVSAMHPFRPSFYQRFGYVNLPRSRTVRFSPTGLAPLLSADLPGHVTMTRIADGYDTYRAYLDTVMAVRHGFAVLPDSRARQRRDDNDRWLLAAYHGDQVVGATTYQVTGFAGELVTDELLATNALGRTLLLSFLAHHRDQIATVVTTVSPTDLPELWLTDLEVDCGTAVALPQEPPPMARVLSLAALADMPVGPGRVVVDIVGDHLLGGTHELDGTTGTLQVSRPTAGATIPTAVLTAAGLSGLVYGVLDPDEVVLRGFGAIPDGAAQQLAALFPRAVPWLSVHF